MGDTNPFLDLAEGERDQLIELLLNRPWLANSEAIADYLIIKNVRIVKHGKWIGKHSSGSYDDYKCSICGAYEEGTRNSKRLGNYCSNCGSRMDAGE